MKRTMSLILFLVLSITVWCTPLFAAPAREVFGFGPQTMTVIGETGGVDMTGQGAGGTLSVGVAGTQTNIFSGNDPLGTWPGLAVSTDVASLSNILLFGSTNVYGDIGTSVLKFLNIAGGATGETDNFLGTVFATSVNVGPGTVNFNSGTGTNVGAVNFTGDGTVGLAANTTITGALTTAAGAQTGTLNLAGGSAWSGAVGGAIGLRSINVLGGSNTAGVSATITGAVDTYAFSLGTNTLNIAGALTIETAAPNSLNINTTLASSTVYGRIIKLSGITSLPTTLGVNVLVPSTSYIPVGTEFTIIQSAAGPGTSVVAVTVQNPTNPLYTFAPVPLAGTTNGQVVIRTTGIPLTTSSNPVVDVLADVPSSPDMDVVLSAVNALSDATDVDNAVAQLAPSTPTLAAPLVAFRETRQFQDLWLYHLESIRCSEVSALDKTNTDCQKTDPKSGMWVKGFGYSGNQDAEDGFTEYTAKTIGGMLAYDMPINLETRAGLGIGYGQTTIEGKTFDADTDFDTYQATAYIGHDSGPWFINGDLSFGWNEYSSRRHMVFPGFDRTANADYSGQTYTAFANTGYHLPLASFTFTPLASMQYSRVDVDSYTETGAGDVNLKVDSQSYDILESGLGMKVERAFTYSGGSLVPEVHVKWLHKIINPEIEQTAAYAVPGSTSFTKNGLKTADDTFNAGAGLTFLSCVCNAKTWSLEGVYDYDWTNGGYAAHQLMAKVTVRF